MPTTRHQALKKALQLEHDGMAYYAAAMDKCNSEMGRRMFDYLCRSEKSHIKRITEIFHALEEGGQWPDSPLLDDAPDAEFESIFCDAMRRLQIQQYLNTDDLQALQEAAEFERNGNDFYAQRAIDAEDPFEQAFYRQLASEEEHHLRAIEDSIQMLKDPQGFFSTREKGTMAG